MRFGEEILDAGFTTVPNLVLRHYAHLGITPAEMMFTIHVWEFWWTEREPYPALSTIAERMNMTRRNVRKYVQNLRDKGFLIVTERFDEHGQTTSEYDFSPLIQAVLDRSRTLGTNGPRGAEQMDRPPRNVRSPEEDPVNQDEYQEDRDRIEARDQIEIFVRDFSREFRDRAPLSASVTRATNLLTQFDGDMDDFIPLLYEARARAKRATNVRNRMAYFFEVLTNLVEDATH